SGKYRVTESGVQSQDGKSRLDNPDMQQFMQNRERTNRVLNGLGKVAAETELAPAQVALAWLLHRSVPIIPIIGARKVEQLKTNLRIAEIRLSDSQLRLLDEVSQIEPGFPHDFLNKPMVQSF